MAAQNSILMLAPLVAMAGFQRLTHPFQHFLIEIELIQQRRELRLQRLFTHIFAPTIGRVAAIAIGVTGAVIIDVFALLDLRHHGAAAIGAFHEA
ncbi:MAG: hypothetical protein P1U65_01195 [Minwuia sp.]|nr:hypothetical protein [Minwuia sp.]